MLRFLIGLCVAVSVTSVLGQTTYTWTGAADGTSLATAGNWTTNGINPATTLPNGTFGDVAQWNGTTSNLILTYGGSGWPGTGSGSLGVSLVLTANQTNSVQIISSVPLSPLLPVFAVTNNSPAASFTLGDSTANNLTAIAWPVGAVHPFVNNSPASCTINPSVKWQAGDSDGYTYDFSGTGNWTANSYLMPDNGFFTNFVQVDGPGSVFWSPNKRGTYSPNNDSLAAVSINGGALVIQFRGAFGSASTQPITNNSILDFEASSTNYGVISGNGQLIVNGGALTLAGNNTYTGSTIVSNNGMLFVNGSNAAAATIVNAGILGGTGTLSGPVTMNAGSTLLPSTSQFGQVLLGTLTINNDLTIGGNLIIDVNKSVSPSNDLVVVSGLLTNTGTGTLGVRNLGAGPCVSGDKFILFSKPLPNGAALSVSGANLNWVNNLAVDGSITVSSVPYQFTWTGAADGTNLATPGNFTTDGVNPSTTVPNSQNSNGGAQVPAIWNGLTTSNLVLTFGALGWGNAGLGTIGNNLITTTNQTNSVQIISPVGGSPNMGFFAMTNNSPSTAFVLGDSTTNNLLVTFRPNGVLHNFVNNSTAACIINPNVKWQAGGGNGITYDFGGTGNWIVNSYLMSINGATASTVQVDGPGTVFWSAGAVGSYTPGSPLSNIVINGGALILKSAFPSNNNQLLKTAFAVSTSLIYAPSNGTDAQAFSNAISGSGQLIVNGGTLTLGGTNTYSGGTTISNGTLALTGTGSISNSPTINLSAGTILDVSGAGGSLTLMPGQTLKGNGTVNGNLNVTSGATIAPGFSIGAAAINGNLNLNSGTVVANINESSSPSNTLYQVTGSISSIAGTLKLLNFGPSLNGGDKFKIFNQAVSGGASMTILSPGFTATNNLAVDGSVTVGGIQPPGSSQITLSISGNQLTLNWPSAWTGLHLQVQTNTLGTNWITIPGTDTNNSYIASVVGSASSVFYRLAP